jgi:CBS domain containing-hemolysin-like protein
MNGLVLEAVIAAVALLAAGWLRLLSTAIRGLDPETLAWPALSRAPAAVDSADHESEEAPIVFVLARFMRAAQDLEAGAVLALAVAATAAAPFLDGRVGGVVTIIAGAVLAALLGVFVPERLAAGREARLLGRTTPAVLALASVLHPLARAADLIVLPFAARAQSAPAPPPAIPAPPPPAAPAPPAAAAPAPPPAATGLRDVLTFVAATVDEVMTPRADVVGVESGSTVADLARIVRTTRRGTYPIYGMSLDDVGMTVSVADLLGVLPGDYVDLHARPATVVPESKRVADLVAEMRAEGTPFVLVVDEFGALAGIANLHDLIGELVGEVVADSEESEFESSRVDDDTWILNPFLKIERVNEITGLDLPAGDYQTLAGYILFELGRIPRAQEHLHLPAGDLEILAADARRILSVSYRRTRDARRRPAAAPR